MLLDSGGPITDYIGAEEYKEAAATLIASGIGRESALKEQRQGLVPSTIKASGRLPFKVNQVWSLGDNALVFDLLEMSFTAVFTLDISSGQVS